MEEVLIMIKLRESVENNSRVSKKTALYGADLADIRFTLMGNLKLACPGIRWKTEVLEMLFTIGGYSTETAQKQRHSAKEIRRAVKVSRAEAELDKARHEAYMRFLIGG